MMNTIHDTVRTVITSTSPGRTGWGRVQCPFCLARVGKADRRRSFAFYFPKGIFKCHRCGIKGRLNGYVTEHTEEEYAAPTYTRTRAPDWFLPSTRRDVLQSIVARPGILYAERRGFDFAIRAALGMGVVVSGEYAESIVVPHRGGDGVWWGFTARKWFSVCPQPYMYPPGMRRDRLYNDQVLQEDTEDPVLLMEGVLDTALYTPDGIGGLGKPIEAHVDVLRRARRPICVVLDGDAWKEGERFMYRLRFEKLCAGAIRMPPGRDPNDKQIDPSVVRRAALRSLKETRAVRIDERTQC